MKTVNNLLQRFNIRLSYLIFWVISLLLVSCGTTPDALLTVNSVTQTDTPIPTYTSTSTTTITVTSSVQPSKTPIPTKTQKPSDTPTPSPTIKPTFKVVEIATYTPAQEAQCPKVNPELAPDLNVLFNQQFWILDEESTLDFLNAGGTPQAIISAFLQEFAWFEEDLAIQHDLTGDNVPEFIFSDETVVSVFGCENEKYKTLLRYTEDPASLRGINFTIAEDMNLNGIPELITNAQSGHSNVEHFVTIFEWNGNQLESIIQGKHYTVDHYFPNASITGVTQVSIQDLDGNGTIELILASNPPFETTTAYEFGLPWRNETHIYSWTGDLFLLSQIEFSPPEYRFQAVQDGDRATQDGDYEQAQEFYQQAISNELLEGWSKEQWSYEIRSISVQPDEPPLPTPIPDLTEYPNLSAYAHFRILLLHILRGNSIEAENEFNILNESFQLGQPGYAFVELATAFWTEYQKSANIENACAKAIEYTELHPVEVLSYLGNGEYARAYFGKQSLDYEPDSVCPFE